MLKSNGFHGLARCHDPRRGARQQVRLRSHRRGRGLHQRAGDWWTCGQVGAAGLLAGAAESSVLHCLRSVLGQEKACADLPLERRKSLDLRVQDAGAEIVRAKCGKGSATLSLGRRLMSLRSIET